MAWFDCTVGGGNNGSTLTVTCYSGFAGLTISCTNGVDTYTETCPSSSPYEVKFKGLADGSWTISTTYNGETYSQIIDIVSTAEFYPTPDGATVTPTDDIQIWLNCANIWDKTYTTVAQVLADTTTLLALVNSSNAVDYMARSTTFASDVCSDATAMGYIGNNDYCAESLLADSTWKNAIINSAYMESVLTVKVPTMTSDTTPSGTCSIYGTPYSGGYEAFRAFDGNNNTSAQARVSNPPYDGYIRYEFTNEVTCYAYRYKMVNPSSSSYSFTYTPQMSTNGGTTWVNIGNSETAYLSPAGSYDSNLKSATVNLKAKNYQIKMYAGSYYAAGAFEVQFYCR